LQNVRRWYPGLHAGEAVFQYISKACLGVRQALSQAQREGSWLAAGTIRPGIRRRYTEGVFFVGNIVGEAHPVVAEGISMAMQSAWLLTQVLLLRSQDVLTGKNFASAGQEYTKQWTKHFANRIHVAALFSSISDAPASRVIIIANNRTLFLDC